MPEDLIYLSSEGIKHDQDKLRYDLIPPDALEGFVKILTFGAKKYEDRNWEKGMKWSRLFGALMRHSWAWFRGEDLDPETGLNHMFHACCCCMFLAAYTQRAHLKEFDDRPIKGK